MKTNIIEVSDELMKRHKIKGFILPANSGTTARAFFDYFGPDWEYFAIGNPSTSHEKGYVIHYGMTPETKTDLETLGFEVVLQEVSAFQPYEESSVFRDHVLKMQSSYEKSIGAEEIQIEGTTLPWIVESTIRALHNEQVKTCVEIALMAGESEKIDHKAKYISVCTPSRWSTDLPDCAIVINPSTPATFFQHPPRIFEIEYSKKP